MDVAGGLAPRSIETSHSNTSPEDLEKRKDEDEDPEEFAKVGTELIRKGMMVSKFGELANPTWYQIDPKKSDAEATFTSFATCAKPIKPDDAKQTQNLGNGVEWDDDHILDLQVPLGAFKNECLNIDTVRCLVIGIDRPNSKRTVSTL
ncbi:MAG: hypothetical protein LQ352_003832 [Teloschistes flavicans]|nr:MAG: hypothetical protein LQ352_003832 [Teloschistes flavicans]